MPAVVELAAVIIDCGDPVSLAEFYRKMTGWEITGSNEDCVYLGNGGAAQLGFQRVAGYQSPHWPDAVKHAHLDFTVTDVEHAARQLLAIGATMPEFQPGEGQWVVLADPEGHLFCLTAGD
jgi:predicted enzyme related to lactoylglutathione lyase